MANPARWIIKKKASGRVLGPYETKDVLELLSQEEINEDDQISVYPGATWHPISQTPEFFDHLIALLEKSLPQREPDFIDDSTVSPRSKTIHVEKTQAPSHKDSNKETSKNSSSRKDRDNNHKDSSFQKLEKVKASEIDREVDVVDLKTKEDVVKKSNLKGIVFYTLIMIVFVGLASFLWLEDKKEETQAQTQVRLRKPQFLQTNKMTEKEVDKLLKSATGHIFNDTFSHYSKAQDNLIEIIENYSKNNQAVGLLCMTYLELWPYSYQDRQDLETISFVLQRSLKRFEAVDPFICKTVYLWLKGNHQEAARVSSQGLDYLERLQKNRKIPPEYYKAFFLYLQSLAALRDSSPDTALEHIESAIKNLRVITSRDVTWLRLNGFMASLYRKKGQGSDAERIYRSILKLKPDHPIYKIKLGTLLLEQKRNTNEAYGLLYKGAHSSSRLTGSIRSQAFLNLGVIELQRNQNQKAFEFFKLSYKWNPLNKKAENFLAQISKKGTLEKYQINVQRFVFEGDQLLREGRVVEACSSYKTGYEIQPLAFLALKLGECAWELSSPSEAIRWLEKAVKLDPKFIEAYIKLSSYYSSRYQFKIASKVLLKARSLDPKNHQILRGFCSLQYKTKNALLAIQFCKKALSIYPEDDQSLVLLARAYLLNNDYNKALEVAHRAVLLSSTTAEAQTVYIKALRFTRGAQTALSYANDLSEKFPQVVDYYLVQSEILQSLERYEDSQEMIEQALHFQIKNKKIHIAKADLYKKIGEQDPGSQKIFYEEAIASYQDAISLDPSDPIAFIKIGIISLEAARFESERGRFSDNFKDNLNEAKNYFNKVKTLNPRYPRINHYLAEIYFLKKDYPKVLENLKKEKEINPNLVDSYLLAAQVYQEQKSYSLCAREYQKAVSLSPQNSNIYIKIATCYRLSGKIQLAVNMIEQARKLDSGNYQVYKELATIYQALGEKDKAVKGYQAYLSLNPSAPDRPEIKEIIKRLGK